MQLYILLLEKKMATHSIILAWKSHGQRSLMGYSPWGRKRNTTSSYATNCYICVRASQSWPTLCDSMDSARQAPLSMGILQARILEGVVLRFSRVSSQPRDGTQVSPHCRWILYNLSCQGSPRILEWVVMHSPWYLLNPGI